MYFLQHWFNLADAACRDALLDSTALRRFVGIDLWHRCGLRHALNRNASISLVPPNVQQTPGVAGARDATVEGCGVGDCSRHRVGGVPAATRGLG